MLLDALRLFAPKLRPLAFVPDAASATLGNHLGIGTLLRPLRSSEEQVRDTAFLPLLEAIRWQCDLLVTDLTGPLPGTRETAGRATAADVPTLFSFLSERGEMILLVSHAQERTLFGDLRTQVWRRPGDGQHPILAGHIWLRVQAHDTVALFLARDHRGEVPHRLDLAQLTAPLLADHARRRPVWCEGRTVFEECNRHRDTVPAFQAAELECRRRRGLEVNLRYPHNLRLEGGVLRVWFDGYQSRLPHFKADEIKTALDGFSIGSLLAANDHRTLILLNALANDFTVRTAPDVRAAYRAAADASSIATAPFYDLAPVQRLGWLHGHTTLTCLADCAPFQAGRTYPLKCLTGEFVRHTTRHNLMGEEEAVSHHHRDLIVQVQAADGKWHEFADWHGRTLRHQVATLAQKAVRHELADLVACFAIPEVRSIAALKPEEYQANLATLAAIEAESAPCAEPIQWRHFQRDDLARFTLHSGGVFAWDKGGGKGLALYAIPRLYKATRTLLVAPEGLHDQIAEDWRKKFGIEPRRVMTVADIESDADLKAALCDRALSNAPLYWLTSYTALGFNGADEWLDDYDEQTGDSTPKGARSASPQSAGAQKLISKKLLTSRAKAGLAEEYWEGIGKEMRYPGAHEDGRAHVVRCVFQPSLATILQDVFDCVVCDEAVRLKSTDSYVSLGVRRLRPAHPVALTGTPVKNRLEDLFWLIHWTAGSPKDGNARLPFANNAAARERFADLFMVEEENLTRADAYREANGKGRTFKRRLPQVTNVHALWRLLGGLVLRRRKEDFGEDLVPKSIVPVKVPAGRAQHEVYRHHLLNPPELNAKGEPMDPVAALLAQLNYLREAALSPDSPNLRGPRTVSDFTPLLDGCFKLIEERLREGRQVMVASPFTHFSVALERRLLEAGVSAIRLDGQTPAKKRGPLARQFKQHRFSVLIAGQQAMGEGHSFDQCDTLILPSLHWAYDVNSQVEDRVHRLTSQRPVTIYVLTVENTIAERLLELYREKSAGAALAIDGRLFAGDDEEVSLGQLLREAQSAFDGGTAATIDERQLEAGWPALCERLRLAEESYRQFHPPIIPDIAGEKVTSGEVRKAVETLALPNESKLVAQIRALSTQTFAALLGTTDLQTIATTRLAFTSYAAQQKATDWKQAWQSFRAQPAAQPAKKPASLIKQTLEALQ